MSNGFPLGLTNSAINFFFCNKYTIVPISIVASRKIYFSTPTFGRQSEKLKMKLLILLSKYFKNVDFNTVVIIALKLLFFSYKYRLPKEMCSTLVYNLVVHDVHLSALGPYVLYTQETLRTLE